MTNYDPTSGLPVELPPMPPGAQGLPPYDPAVEEIRETFAIPVKLDSTKAWVGAIVATIGAGATAALAVLSTTDPLYLWFTIAAAMGTAGGTFLGVYSSTNRPVQVS